MFNLVTYRKRNDVPLGDMLSSFTPIFERPFGALTTGRTRSLSTDIRETEGAYFIEAELPGFAKEDIKVTYEDGYLTIRAERKVSEEAKDDQDRVLRSERYHGQYMRRFYADNIDEDRIAAKLENGVLKLEVPKVAEAVKQARQIDIQ
ncbi:Hsp20/alpha crystallin family protein [Paenibacillus sp. IB182496]|uniref:Hsp20/alpha crystallin family protein n=1 Tax=Paenibacillus sabuli TaxID=2772509 RepID=A0A927BQE2_9BACL|nr:Hsp20/alpha crystallin family protein [Paenibacillus sabuli]MBD2844827.1 Hsp20/alpha crystallin family protein [Paenibacillus sabuli]